MKFNKSHNRSEREHNTLQYKKHQLMYLCPSITYYVLCGSSFFIRTQRERVDREKKREKLDARLALQAIHWHHKLRS